MGMPVVPITPSTLKNYTGTRGMSDGTNAIALSATSQPCMSVVVQADPDNVPDTFLGVSATNTPMQLTPGRAMKFRVQDVQQIFFKTATNGTTVNVNWWAEG